MQNWDPTTELETYSLIRQAALDKHQILAVYDGLPRELCPHELGKGPGGHRQGLFYQFGGQSHSGLKPNGSPDNFRCMLISGLSDVHVRKGPWHTAGERSSCVAEVDVSA